MIRRAVVALAALASALSLAAAPAHAEVLARWDLSVLGVRYLTPGVDVIGPELAGDRVVWGRGGQERRATFHAAPGGTLGRAGWNGQVALAGAAGHVAFLQQLQVGGSKYSLAQIRAGRVVADGRAVAACTGATETLGGLPPLGLAGDVLVFGDTCGAGGVHALDLVTGAAWSTPRALLNGAFAAGGVVAFADAPADAATGAPLAAYPPLADGTSIVDGGVQADGTEAVVLERGYPRTLALRVPGAAAVRPVPLDTPLVGAHGDVRDLAPYARMGAGRIAVRVRSADGADTIALATPDGRTRPQVDFGAGTTLRPAGEPVWWSFDGTRLAWAAETCERITIGVTRVGDPVERLPTRVCAYPRILSKAARVDRHRHYSIRMTCAKRCGGILYLIYGGHPLRSDAVRFALPGSQRAQRVRVALPRGANLRYGVEVRLPRDVDAPLHQVRLLAPASR